MHKRAVGAAGDGGTDQVPDLLVVAGPSCSGKTTFLKMLLERRPLYQRPVTTTTRPPRAGETDGVDYHFVSEDEFLARVEAGAFLEHQIIHGKSRYGLEIAAVRQVRKEGRFPAVVLDVQGALELKGRIRMFSVFLAPGSKEEVVERIHRLRDVSEVGQRVRSVPQELAVQGEFDVVVDNPEGRMGQAFSRFLAACDERIGRHLAAPRPRVLRR